MSSAAQLPRSLCLGLLIATAGCSSWHEWRRQAAIDSANELVAKQRATMEVVAMKHGYKATTGPRLRIVVTPEAVHVDNAAWLADMKEEQLEAVTAKANGDPVVQVTNLQPTAEAVAAAVRRAVEVEQKTYDSLDTFVGKADLLVDGRVPFLTLTKVLDGVAQGGVEKLRFAVDGPKGERYFDAVSPSPCARVEYTRRAEVGLQGYCAVPEIEVRAEGLLVRTRRRAAEGKGCEAELELGPQELEWDGRVMLPDAKACPSVPMAENGHDVKTLVKLLHDLAAIVPGCTSALINAGPGVTWAQVAPVVVATTANSSFVNTALVSEGAKAPGAELDCTNGMTPRQLPKVAERLAKAARDVNRLSIMGHLDDLEGEEE